MKQRVSAYSILICLISCSAGTEPPVRPPAGGRIPLWSSLGLRGIGPMGIDASSVYVIDNERAIHALDKTTGIERWRMALPTTGANSGILVSQGIVVAAVNEMIALDATTGGEKWRLGASQNVGTLAFSINESLVFPTIYRGTGIARAIDLRTGDTRWETSIIPDTVVVTPIVDQVRVREPNVNANSVAASFVWWKGPAQPKGGIAVLDVQTGVLRWTKMLPVVNPLASTFPTRAAIANGGVAVASADGHVYLFDELTGALRWTGPPEDKGTPSAPQPVILDDRPVVIVGQQVIAASTIAYVTAFDLLTGERRWRQNTNRSSIHKLITFGNNHVLMTQFGGEITILDASTGGIRWQWIPRAVSEHASGVAFAGDTLFVNFITGGVAAFRIPN